MKRYDFDLESLIHILFPQHLINTKIQILEILMEATRYILATPFALEKSKKSSLGKMILVIDKMSRLFFYTENKSYSVVFPFTVSEQGDCLSFVYQIDGVEIEVDNELISNFISVIKNDDFHSNYSIDFVSDIDSMETNYNKNFWVFMRNLLLMEDGYIRYDIDANGYNDAKKNKKEHTHPLHHFDVFYSSTVTFKLGLDEKISENDFIDCINVKTDCKYLKKIL